MFKMSSTKIIFITVLFLNVLFLKFFFFPRDDAPVEHHMYHMFDTSHSCGQICFSIASKLLGRPLSLDESKLYVPVNSLGKTSISEMVSAFQSRRLVAVGVKLTRSDLTLIRTPIILFVNDDHFILSYYTLLSGLSFFDPPRPVISGHDVTLPYDWKGDSIIVTADQNDMNDVLAKLQIRH